MKKILMLLIFTLSSMSFGALGEEPVGLDANALNGLLLGKKDYSIQTQEGDRDRNIMIVHPTTTLCSPSLEKYVKVVLLGTAWLMMSRIIADSGVFKNKDNSPHNFSKFAEGRNDLLSHYVPSVLGAWSACIMGHEFIKPFIKTNLESLLKYFNYQDCLMGRALIKGSSFLSHTIIFMGVFIPLKIFFTFDSLLKRLFFGLID